MAIKIKEMYGYQISYDPRRQYFIIENTDGTELAIAPTQEKIEAKAKALSKREFKRIPVVCVRHGEISKGKLTSLVRDDRSAWVSMETDKSNFGSGREKISLAWTTSYYELTEANLPILENIQAKSEEIKRTQTDIVNLEGTLENPINLAYFGITA